MAIHRDKTGDAMHRRETIRLDSFDDLAKITPPLRPVERVLAIKEWISNELQRKGWPDPNRQVMFSDQEWQYVAGSFDARLTYTPGWSYVENRTKADKLSDDYLLAEAFRFACTAMHALESRSPDEAFGAGYALAAQIHTVFSRRAHLRKVEVGKRQIEQGKTMRAARTENSFSMQYGDEAQRYANDLHERKPTQSWAAITAATAQKYGVSVETVKKSLTNPKKSR